MSIAWRRVDGDRIRSDCSAYWIARDSLLGTTRYCAMWRPQNPQALGEHLGCHDSGAAAKAACEEHVNRRAAA